ncbi:MAG: aminoacyl-tRNA hydrolase [Candidatus Sungbacteria bacterium]|nr:aminoacyl-tRNA hydrolase [Candidatus Sungbacteria bacterium]
MIFLIGLGNPGKEFDGTRHNIGREIVAAFGEKHDFNDPTEHKKIKALVSESSIGKQKYIVVLPQTFMNKSGEAAKAARLLFKAKPEQTFVIHDDVDIVLGSTKLSFDRDSAGHKGVESVMRALGTKKFWRFRIGVGANLPKVPLKQKRDKKGKIKHTPAENIVLKKFTPAEAAIAKKVKAKTVAALGELAKDPPEKIMNHYNK